jgi:prepilin-type N-terminal cleavage/methylation domain-containing protein
MKILRNTNGFTLIEILIATVIITIASLGIATLTVGVIRGNSFSKRLTTATMLAQDRLEQAKRLGYSKVDTIAVTENYGNIVNYSGYKRETFVIGDTPGLNMKTVNVVVYWDAGKHSINLSTILAE